MDALVLNAGEGRAVPLGPVRMLVIEDGTRTRGTLGIAESEVPPDVPTPPCRFPVHNLPALRFSALLDQESSEVDLALM